LTHIIHVDLVGNGPSRAVEIVGPRGDGSSSRPRHALL
jgi:hypothetical protein